MQVALDRPHWGAGRGRSALDCAWIQAAGAEADSATARHGVSIIADHSKYYDKIRVSRLRN
eukprot:5263119-Pyramimonas_sp.AAC.1